MRIKVEPGSADRCGGGDFSPVRGVSAVSAALNTPMAQRVFRQGPDHISAPAAALQPVSCGRIPGAAFHRWPVWGGAEGAGHSSFVWRRDGDRMPAWDSLCVYLRQMDKQEESPAKHLSLQPPGIHRR